VHTTCLEYTAVSAAAPDAPAHRVPRALTQLSARECEVLDLLARGYRYEEVGRLLLISLATVQSHVKSIYSKLAVHSRSEAVYEASKLGLLSRTFSSPF
jgi:ATP/maltotriose-dependent transcriptional regulator MalT